LKYAQKIYDSNNLGVLCYKMQTLELGITGTKMETSLVYVTRSSITGFYVNDLAQCLN